MTANQVLLPWPPKVLSPNARAHWRARSKAAKAYRYSCFMGAKLGGLLVEVGETVVAGLGLNRHVPPDAPRDQPVADLAKDADRDFFMSADEAKAYGVVDQVTASRKIAKGS